MQSITLKDIIDILLVATIFYGTFRLLKRNGVMNLFWGILAFILVWFIVSYGFHLELTGAILDQVVSVGALALIVIFQNEIRAFIYRVGSKVSMPHFLRKDVQHETHDRAMDQIVMACRHMSEHRIGALIIIKRLQDLHEFSDTGEKVDAVVSARMIENIFFKNSPLHDGAMFVSGNRISSAGCILPVSQKSDIPKHYGLRHRAALGITERTDAIAIVVSEETGEIALAQGDVMRPVSVQELATELMK
jgi:uncharacterized protein (TIGR00159 family)